MRDVDKKRVDPIKDAAIARNRYLKVCILHTGNAPYKGSCIMHFKFSI